jgi:hypothetical protein
MKLENFEQRNIEMIYPNKKWIKRVKKYPLQFMKFLSWSKKLARRWCVILGLYNYNQIQDINYKEYEQGKLMDRISFSTKTE